MEQTPGLQANPKTILVVDDDPIILKLVTQFLAGGNYRVLTAIDGTAGLQQSKDYKGEIDLLLCDFHLPGMSGVDLATKMSVDRRHLQVLLMSGFAEGMITLNEGWHFLAKPFIPAQLRALIAGLVSPDRPSKFVT